MQQRSDPIEATSVAAIRSGDRSTFDGLTRKHRREIHVHCYRMVGSFDEAEDLTQETFLRAWRARGEFEGRSTYRVWLYRIATNLCIDAIRRRPERRLSQVRTDDWVDGSPPPRDLHWLQPYPDALLETPGPLSEQPDEIALSKDALSIAVLTSIQLLPVRQRAALVLREVLGWSTRETADLLECSVAAVNSALQRARAVLAENSRAIDSRAVDAATNQAEQDLVAAYVEAHHRADVDAIVALLRNDIRVTMPPDDVCFVGIEQTRSFFERIFDLSTGLAFRLVPTRANGQPAVANYLSTREEPTFRAFSIDVLHVVAGAIREITTFFVPHHFGDFGLPDQLEGRPPR